MSLGADISAELPGLRAAAESMMVDSCVIGIRVRSDELDEETGQYTFTIPAPVYEGPCRYKAGGTAANTVDVQGQSLVEQADILSLPVRGSEAVTKDMVAVVSLTFDDAVLTVRVVADHRQTFATARRLPVELVT